MNTHRLLVEEGGFLYDREIARHWIARFPASARAARA